MSIFPKHNYKVASVRRGAATVELLLAAPILILLLLLVFMITGGGITRWHTLATSRYSSFEHVAQWWDASKNSQAPMAEIHNFDELDDILTFGAPFDPKGGWLQGHAEQELVYAPLDMAKDFPLSEESAFVFTGPWDHREIIFEPQDEHPRLITLQKIWGLELTERHYGEIDFTSLGFITASLPTGNLDRKSMYAHLNKNNKVGVKVEQSLIDDIKRKESWIETERAKEDPAWDKINRWKNEIEEHREDLKLIAAGFESDRNARKTKPSQPDTK